MSFASIIGRRTSVASRPEARYVASGALIVGAVLLVMRRLAGALTVPLDPGTALALGLLLALITMLTAADAAGRIVSVAAMAAVCAALTLPGTTPFALVGLWIPAVAGVALLLRRESVPAKPEFAGPSRSREPAEDRRVRQQLTRTLEPHGDDVCRGKARAEFVVGQRTAAIHLSFCPPFASVPKLEVDVVDDSGATVKVGQALPYAARIDVKLPQPASAKLDVAVQFKATCS
jgi:hypothetical protein